MAAFPVEGGWDTRQSAWVGWPWWGTGSEGSSGECSVFCNTGWPQTHWVAKAGSTSQGLGSRNVLPHPKTSTVFVNPSIFGKSLQACHPSGFIYSDSPLQILQTLSPVLEGNWGQRRSWVLRRAGLLAPLSPDPATSPQDEPWLDFFLIINTSSQPRGMQHTDASMF